MISCLEKEKNFSVTIHSTENINFENTSTIELILYGFDENIADVSASILHRYTLGISKIPESYRLEYNENWSKSIEPKSSGEYGYYLALKGNINTTDDYVIDFSNYNSGQGTIFVNSMSELNQKIWIKRKGHL